MDNRKSIMPIVCYAISCFLVVLLIVSNILYSVFYGYIEQMFSTAATKGPDAEILAASDELVQTLEADSIVMLKNSNNCLPLNKANKNINVFGYAGTNAGFLLRGVGSGSSTITASKAVYLLDALKDAGYHYNEEITGLYSTASRSNYSLTNEIAVSAFSSTVLQNAKNFSNTALVVFARNGGENIGEIPTSQGGTNSDRTYMQLSLEEESLLNFVGENFENVIVILNTANVMHCAFLENPNVDAALFVGLTGQSGAKAIPRILYGDVNPSGKVTDVYTYVPDYDPTYINHAVNGSNIQYQEDIYYGYKWYETADAEGYFDDVTTDYGTGYDGVVQYPFGYGLSYSTFTWEVLGQSLPLNSQLTKDSEIEIAVRVRNTSAVDGKDVVQLYGHAPYYPGGIEKSEVKLLDFYKVFVPAGEYRDVKLSFTAYDLASYDAYGKNGNGKTGYELDNGIYEVRLMRDSHTIDTCEDAVMKYEVASIISLDQDTTTGVNVGNAFTGATAYSGVPIDGSNVGCPDYMTRADFEGTFPKVRASNPTNSALITQAQNYSSTAYDQTSKPQTGVDSELRLVTKEGGAFANAAELKGTTSTELFYNDALIAKLVANFNDPTWDSLIDQMTEDELLNLVHRGGFRTIEVASIGKPFRTDTDGPAGFNFNTTGGDAFSETDWTAYPSETLIGCSWNKQLCFMQGLSMGAEGNATSPQITGWYAPGVNLHRSNYTARNFEYYSEDGVLSGKLAAEVIKGAKTNGLTCYLKHFVVSEPGPNPRNVNTWLTEQNLRENYLKPFEIAVKEGESNAMMSAFNNLGANWCGASYPLLTTILRDEWGFKGSVITDWCNGGSVGTYGNVKQGVRAGNDLWLNPSSKSGSTPTGGLVATDATDVYCAKLAAKNIVYTFVDTYNYAVEHKDDDIADVFRVDLGSFVSTSVFPWWNIVLVIIDVLLLAGAGVLVFFATKKLRQKQSD